MKVAIVAHHSRAAQALALAEQLGATVFMDPATNGANWNHRRALAWAAEQSERVVIVEDDAQPVPGFLELAAAWCEGRPDDLLSFYLGMSRPPQFQEEIRTRLAQADAAGNDFIELGTLIHAVAYSVPVGMAGKMLDHMLAWEPADFTLGRAWKQVAGRSVVYTVPSLADHADTPNVEPHQDRQPRREPRRAWRLHSEGNQGGYIPKSDHDHDSQKQWADA